MTVAPSRAKRREMALPLPIVPPGVWPAPTTTAILSSSRPGIFAVPPCPLLSREAYPDNPFSAFSACNSFLQQLIWARNTKENSATKYYFMLKRFDYFVINRETFRTFHEAGET
jgi:hypothetical protein